jgi:hypothetical protein
MSLIDFTGLSPWDPLTSFAQPEPGHYVAKVSAIDPNYNAGKSTKFTVDLPTMQTDLYIGNEPGEKGANARKWLHALMAVSPSQAAADQVAAAAKAGSFKFDPATQAAAAFMNKTIHVLVTEVPGVDEKGRKHFPDKEFITKAQYDALVAGTTKAPAKSAPTNGTTSVAQPATPATAATAPMGDVLSALFKTQ